MHSIHLSPAQRTDNPTADILLENMARTFASLIVWAGNDDEIAVHATAQLAQTEGMQQALDRITKGAR